MGMMGAGAAANVAGQAMQIAAAIAANRAAERGYRRRMEEQKGYRNQALAAMYPITGQPGGAPGSASAQAANEQIARGSAERQVGYAQANAQPMATPTASSQVNAADVAQASLLGQQRGNMAGASDWRRDQEISRIRAQEIINNAINKAQGSSNIAGIQHYGELHSKDALKTGGQFLSSLGSMGMSMGATGGAAPAEAPLPAGVTPKIWGSPGAPPVPGLDFEVPRQQPVQEWGLNYRI